jgi:hypothetical protein
VSIAYNETKKPLTFTSVVLPLLTLFAVYGFKPSVNQIVIANVLIIIVAGVIGKLIVWLGIAKYNSTISNEQNPEIMQILQEIKEIKEKIK